MSDSQSTEQNLEKRKESTVKMIFLLITIGLLASSCSQDQAPTGAAQKNTGTREASDWKLVGRLGPTWMIYLPPASITNGHAITQMIHDIRNDLTQPRNSILQIFVVDDVRASKYPMDGFTSLHWRARYNWNPHNGFEQFAWIVRKTNSPLDEWQEQPAIIQNSIVPPAPAAPSQRLSVNSNLVCLSAEFHTHPTSQSFVSSRCITGIITNSSDREFRNVKVKFRLPIEDPDPQLHWGFGDAVLAVIHAHEALEYHAQLLVGAARGQSFEFLSIESFP